MKFIKENPPTDPTYVYELTGEEQHFLINVLSDFDTLRSLTYADGENDVSYTPNENARRLAKVIAAQLSMNDDEGMSRDWFDYFL